MNINLLSVHNGLDFSFKQKQKKMKSTYNFVIEGNSGN